MASFATWAQTTSPWATPELWRTSRRSPSRMWTATGWRHSPRPGRRRTSASRTSTSTTTWCHPTWVWRARAIPTSTRKSLRMARGPGRSTLTRAVSTWALYSGMPITMGTTTCPNTTSEWTTRMAWNWPREL